MVDVQLRTKCNTWEMVAASMDGEPDANNKRFRRYVRILKRNFYKQQKVYQDVKNSTIFVIPLSRLESIERIIEDYGEIFAETF